MEPERQLTKLNQSICLVRNLVVMFSIVNVGMAAILIAIKPALVEDILLVGILCVLAVVLLGTILALCLVRKSPDLTLLFTPVILFVSGIISGILIPFVVRLNNH